MGNTSITYHVRSESAADVARCMKKAKRVNAFLTAPSNGWVSMMDQASEDLEIEDVTKFLGVLTKSLKTSGVLLVVADSSDSGYLFFLNGKVVDCWATEASVFGWKKKEAEGNPAALEFVLEEKQREKLEKIIWLDKKKSQKHIMETGRLRDIAVCFGINQGYVLTQIDRLGHASIITRNVAQMRERGDSEEKVQKYLRVAGGILDFKALSTFD